MDFHKELTKIVEKVSTDTNSLGEPIASTPEAIANFWKWFGDSKVKDEQGRPLVVYHGTNADFEEFKESKNGQAGRGMYFSPFNGDANQYGKKLISTYLKIKNPRRLKRQDIPMDSKSFRTNTEGLGFDGVIIDYADGEMSEIVVFSPNQIKSITNKGTYSDSHNMNEDDLSAWHGTANTDPYDKFDYNKVGGPGGEGAQAYGYGLYFSSKKEIGDHYRKKLSSNNGGTTVFDPKTGEELAHYNPVKITQTPQERAAWYVSTSTSGPKQIFSDARDKAIKKGESKEVIELLNKWVEIGAVNGTRGEGKLYQVDIPEDNEYLDWDKPLEKQNRKVRNALKNAGILKQYRENLSDFSSPQATRGMSKLGSSIYEFISWKLGSAKKASDKLKSIGIPGIRYLDGGSRASGEGTFNYVIFDDSKIKILAHESIEKVSEDDLSAWHGTGNPDPYDKFDYSKVGGPGGEGAQAYGWGLYFANKKEIGDHYRNTLSPPISIIDLAVNFIPFYKNGELVNYSPKTSSETDYARAMFQETVLSKQKEITDLYQKDGKNAVIGLIRKTMAQFLQDMKDEEYPPEAIKWFENEVKKANSDNKFKVNIKIEKGKLYNVDIPEDNEYLFWDGKLSEQTPQIIDGIKKVMIDHAMSDIAHDEHPVIRKGNEKIAREGAERFVKNNKNTSGENVYKIFSRLFGSDKAASDALKAAGIPGIRYLDGGSRASGEGTCNYVIFDDSKIKILAHESIEDDKVPETAQDFDVLQDLENKELTARKAGDIKTAFKYHKQILKLNGDNLRAQKRKHLEQNPNFAVFVSQDKTMMDVIHSDMKNKGKYRITHFSKMHRGEPSGHSENLTTDNALRELSIYAKPISAQEGKDLMASWGSTNESIFESLLILEGQNEDRALAMLKKVGKEADYDTLFSISNGKAKNNKHLPLLTKFYLEGADFNTIKYYYERFIKNTKINQKPIDNFNFQQFQHLVDSSIESTNVEDKEIDNKPVYEDDNVKVFLGDTKEKCIKYGQGTKYEFCIARQDHSNLYHGYRKKGATFYFIYFKNEIAKADAPADMIVIHAYEGGQYQLNYSKPNADHKKTKEQILKEFPALIPFFDEIITHKPHTDREKEIYSVVEKAKSITKLKTLSQQLMWVEIGNEIKDNEWDKVLNKEEILKKYIEVGSYDVPFKVLKQFAKHEGRYWNKIKQRVEIKKQAKMYLSPHEKYLELNEKLEDGTLDTNPKDFTDAAISGNVEAMKKMLENPNFVAFDGTTRNIVKTMGYAALKDAAESGSKEIVDMLLKSGVENRGDFYNSPQQKAAEKGHLEILKTLEDHGFTEGRSEKLELAAQYGHLDVVKFLIQKGARINNETFKRAAGGGNVELVSFLLSNGANVNGEDEEPLIYAAMAGQNDVVKLLLQNGASIERARGRAMSYAVLHDQKDVVRTLLAAGDLPDWKDRGENLMNAVEHSDMEMFKLLFDEGAEINDKVLTLAIAKNKNDIVDFILSQGFDFSVGDTLRHVVDFDNVEMVKKLLDAGADPKSDNNHRAIDIAVINQNLEMTRLLLQHGANPNNSNGHTLSASCDRENPNIEIIKLLLDAGADPSRGDALTNAAFSGKKEIVELFLRKGIDNKLTLSKALNSACYSYNSSLEIIELLLDAGADPNKNKNENLHPLVNAVSKGHSYLVELLLQHGADPNVDDGKPLDVALREVGRRSFHGPNAIERYIEVVKTLLNNGADPNARGIYLNIAITNNDMESVKLLVKKGAIVKKHHLEEAKLLMRGSKKIQNFLEKHLSKQTNENFSLDDNDEEEFEFPNGFIDKDGGAIKVSIMHDTWCQHLGYKGYTDYVVKTGNIRWSEVTNSIVIGQAPTKEQIEVLKKLANASPPVKMGEPLEVEIWNDKGFVDLISTRPNSDIWLSKVLQAAKKKKTKDNPYGKVLEKLFDSEEDAKTFIIERGILNAETKPANGRWKISVSLNPLSSENVRVIPITFDDAVSIGTKLNKKVLKLSKPHWLDAQWIRTQPAPASEDVKNELKESKRMLVIVLNSNNEIIHGKDLFNAAIELGMKKVPVQAITFEKVLKEDFTDTQRKTVYHVTTLDKWKKIQKEGLKVNQDRFFTTKTDENDDWVRNAYGCNPIFLSTVPNKYKAENTIELVVDVTDLTIGADLGSLIDKGAILSEKGFGFEKNFRGLGDEFPNVDLLEPYFFEKAIPATKTLVCLDNIDPSRISVYAKPQKVLKESINDIDHWTSYAKDKTFATENSARNWLKIRSKDEHLANHFPLHKVLDRWKIGPKKLIKAKLFSEDDIKVTRSTFDDVAKSGLVSPGDIKKVERPTWIPISEVTRSEEKSQKDKIYKIASHISGKKVLKAIWIDAQDNSIMDGHHRYEACKVLGFKKIPVQYVHLI